MILNKNFLFIFILIFLSGCSINEKVVNNLWANASDMAKMKKAIYEDLSEESKKFNEKPSDGMSNLYIFGDRGCNLCSMTLVPRGNDLVKNIHYGTMGGSVQNIYLDNQFVGKIDCWQYYLLHLKPGKHILKIDNDEIDLELKANENIYVLAFAGSFTSKNIKNYDEFMKMKSSLFGRRIWFFDVTENKVLNIDTVNYLLSKRISNDTKR
ncbi:MAG: hypothetical protein J6M21_07830 [Campylobacter sp.]|nr:hypothetical protein [Campylobacter sp.]